MLQEFKEIRPLGKCRRSGVGVIIGAAFGKIVDLLVNDIIMPIIGRIFGGLDFTNYFIGLTRRPARPLTTRAAKKAAPPWVTAASSPSR